MVSVLILSISSNVQSMITNPSCKLTQIILNLSPALNAHKNLKADTSVNGILQYISNQRYHCYIALQSKKFEPIAVLTKYWTHSDPCSSILYTCLHSRKWRNSASPLETLEPNSFTCGRFNTKDSSKKLRHVGELFVNISITTRLAWFSLV